MIVSFDLILTFPDESFILAWHSAKSVQLVAPVHPSKISLARLKTVYNKRLEK
jgi:hypothetical protein